MKLVFTCGFAETFGISILPDLLSGMVEAFLKLMKYFVIVPSVSPMAYPSGTLTLKTNKKTTPTPQINESGRPELYTSLRFELLP